MAVACTPNASGSIAFSAANSRLAPLVWLGHLVVALSLIVLATSGHGRSAETTPPVPTGTPEGETNALDLTQAYRQLEEQLRATRSAIEQSRQETKQAAAAAAARMSNALHTVQTSFTAQRTRDLAAMQESNRRIVKLAGTFAAAGFVALFILIWLQWRMNHGLAELALALTAGPHPAPGAIRPESARALPNPATQSDVAQQAPYSPPRPRRRLGRSVERWLFPKPGDSLRRRQFRALRTALLWGLLCAGAVALVLYLVYIQPHR